MRSPARLNEAETQSTPPGNRFACTPATQAYHFLRKRSKSLILRVNELGSNPGPVIKRYGWELRDVRGLAVIAVSPAAPTGHLGQCKIGFYVVEHGMLTMTDSEGVPLRDENTGHRIEMRWLEGKSERTAAGLMTLKMYRDAATERPMAVWSVVTL